MDYDVNHENLLEWITGDKTIACTLSQRKYVNLFRKLSEKYPEDYRLIAENEDGSIYGEVSINCISFRSPIKLTDEQKAERAERAEQARKNRWLT